MVNIIKAEHQKAKRTMRKKFIWGFPLLTFVMAFIFTLGMTNAYAESVWNWWYTLLLPGMIALLCAARLTQWAAQELRYLASCGDSRHIGFTERIYRRL